MKKTLKGFFKPIPKNDAEGSNAQARSGVEFAPPTIITENSSAHKRNRLEFDSSDIIADPGIRNPIEEYDASIRDQVRREYLLKGPCQPRGHDFPRKKQGDSMRWFKEAWFVNYPWLEYSISKDRAYCLYCYLFAKPESRHKAFTSEGVNNWKKAIEIFNEHVGGVSSVHNIARNHSEDFQKQRQSIVHVMTSQSLELESAYRIRLSATLYAIRFLLVQGLAFRGHDESASSLNRGNFLELLKWHANEVESIRNVVGDNAPRNCQLTSPQIQKEMVSACASETSKAIISERRDALIEKNREIVLQKLQESEKVTGRGKNQETSLKRPGDTRWGSHFFTLIRLNDMWESVLFVLDMVSEDGTDAEQRHTAYALFEKMESFNFVFILHLMLKVLGITNGLSNTLQQHDQNIVNAMNLLDSSKALLQALRDDGWNALFQEVSTFCEKKGIIICDMEDHMPVRGRSRREGQMVTYYHYYHNEIFLSVIDLLLVEMNHRFSESSTKLLRCISCLDPSNSFARFDIASLVSLAEMYSEDFSSTELHILSYELQNYILNVKKSSDFVDCGDLASLAKKMVETSTHLVFPLVYRLIELALILPVATASVERVFSAMKIIKTDLRNRMSDDWMNDMLICYIEKELFNSIDDEVILQRFQNMQNRRIQLPKVRR